MAIYSILEYCKHICKTHIEILKNNKQNGWYWDLPAMASICYNQTKTKIGKGYAHNPCVPNQTVWHPKLLKALIELGQIGKKSKIINCLFSIGNCAEQHAANNYMKKYKEQNLNNLYFSEAMRPRTKQVFQPCDNCKQVFPNL